MKTLILKTATEVEFFARGRKLAKLADQGKRLAEERVISFEDPATLLKLLTGARLDLFRAVKEHPGSITDLSDRLHRDRSAVKRDLDELERVGMIELETKLLPGHGRMKEARVTASRFRLQAELV
jgi:predicted transcriptional regulator